MADIPTIVRLSIRANVFTCIGQFWQQIRGTAIGNQISPILSLIVVSHKEYQWHSVFTNYSQPSQQFYIMRYVDNRIMLLPSNYKAATAFKIVTDHDFYQDPVTLEPTGDNKMLGCILNIRNKTISVLLPTEDWQFLHKDCATPIQQTTAVYQCRVSLIKRQAFPEDLRKQQLRDLATIYQHRLLPMKHEYFPSSILTTVMLIFPLLHMFLTCLQRFFY